MGVEMAGGGGEVGLILLSIYCPLLGGKVGGGGRLHHVSAFSLSS